MRRNKKYLLKRSRVHIIWERHSKSNLCAWKVRLNSTNYLLSSGTEYFASHPHSYTNVTIFSASLIRMGVKLVSHWENRIGSKETFRPETKETESGIQVHTARLRDFYCLSNTGFVRMTKSRRMRRVAQWDWKHMQTVFCLENLENGRSLANLGIEGIIILKWILKHIRKWTGFICPRIRSGGGVFRTRKN